MSAQQRTDGGVVYTLTEVQPDVWRWVPEPTADVKAEPKPRRKVKAPFIAYLSELHAENKAAKRVCNVKFTRGRKKGRTHGDFSAEGWAFHREWCKGR